MAPRSWIADQRWRLSMLWQIYGPVRGLFALYLVAVLAGTVVEALALAAIVPLISGDTSGTIGQVFERALAPLDVRVTEQVLVGCVAALFVLRGLARFGALLLAGFMVRSEAIRLQVELFEGYLQLRWEEALRIGQGELNVLLSSQAQQTAELLRRVCDLVESLLYAVVLTAVAVVVAPRFTIVALFIVGSTGVFVVAVGNRVRRLAVDILSRSKEQSTTLLQYSRGAMVLRTFGVGERAVEHVTSIAEDRERVMFRVQRVDAFAQALPDVVFVLALLGVVSYSFSTGGGIAEVGAVVALLFRVSTHMKRFGEFSTIQQLVPALRDIRRHLALFDERRAPSSETWIDRDLPIGEIVIDGLEVRYEGSKLPALTDVSEHVDSGEFIGVVGPSGSGKSTLVMVMIGLMPPTAGRLRMGVASAGDVALVPQQPFLLRGTLESNIRWFRSFSDQEVRTACSAAGLDPLLDRLPDGVETEVAQEGLSLSGGERQRIALARALIGRPKILLLDEATSALDSESERTIQGSLEALRGDTTVVAVAHRLSTVLSSDRIWVIEGGRMVESGRPSSLLGDATSRFAQLAAGQGIRAADLDR